MEMPRYDYIDEIKDHRMKTSNYRLEMKVPNKNSEYDWEWRIVEKEKLEIELIELQRRDGIITGKECEDAKASTRYHFSMCIGLIRYLFSDKYNEEKFIEALNQAYDEMPSLVSKLDHPSLMIYDPAMHEILSHVLTGEAQKTYQNLVDKLDEKIKEHDLQKKEADKRRQIEHQKEQFKSKISKLVLERWHRREALDNLGGIVDQFFDSIDASDIVQRRFDPSVLEKFNIAQQKIKESIMDYPEFRILVWDKSLSDYFRNILEMTPEEYEKKLKETNTSKEEKSNVQETKSNPQQAETSDNNDFVEEAPQKEAIDVFREERAKQKEEDSKAREFIIFEVVTDEKGNKTIVPLNATEYNIEKKVK